MGMEKDSLYMWCSHWDPGKTVDHSMNICALKRDGVTVKVRNTKRKLGLTTRR